MVTQAKVINLHWEEQPTAIQEATLEVEHENGDRQLFVIQILRMTDRMSGEMKRNAKSDHFAPRRGGGLTTGAP